MPSLIESGARSWNVSGLQQPYNTQLLHMESDSELMLVTNQGIGDTVHWNGIVVLVLLVLRSQPHTTIPITAKQHIRTKIEFRLLTRYIRVIIMTTRFIYIWMKPGSSPSFQTSQILFGHPSHVMQQTGCCRTCVYLQMHVLPQDSCASRCRWQCNRACWNSIPRYSQTT